MRWTGEADAYLLVKIIETNQVRVDAAALSESWDFGTEKPTPKAITEHMAKLKRAAKESALGNGTNTSSANVTPTKGSGGTKAPRTPKAKAAVGVKRKRASKPAEKEDGSESTGLVDDSDKYKYSLTMETNDDDDIFALDDIKKEQNQESPPYKANSRPRTPRASTPHPKKIKLGKQEADSGDAADEESDSSPKYKQEEVDDDDQQVGDQ